MYWTRTEQKERINWWKWSNMFRIYFFSIISLLHFLTYNTYHATLSAQLLYDQVRRRHPTQNKLPFSIPFNWIVTQHFFSALVLIVANIISDILIFIGIMECDSDSEMPTAGPSNGGKVSLSLVTYLLHFADLSSPSSARTRRGSRWRSGTRWRCGPGTS